MTTKKTSVTSKQEITSQPTVKAERVVQVNPVARRVQTQEGWMRNQAKMKAQKKR